MAYLPPELAHDHPESIGIPIPGGSFRIEPVDGMPDGTGDLFYRGPNVMMGYAHTAADLAADAGIDELRTGDISRQRRDGLYEVVGRSDRFVKLYGLRIDLQRVESALHADGVTAIAYETVQLPGGTLPLLAPMSEVAGRLAPTVGAATLLRSAGGLGLLMSGVPGTRPASVTVIGGGVAGGSVDSASGSASSVDIINGGG